MHHASAFHNITHINKSGGDNKRCDNARDALAATGFVLTGPTRSIALAILHLTATFFTFLFHDRFLCFELNMILIKPLLQKIVNVLLKK